MIKIDELRKIRREKDILVEREIELTEPLLDDLSMLPTLYEWFGEMMADMPLPASPDSVIQRKKFLFIVMMLYSPATFCGDVTKAGLCSELSRMFEITNVSISRNIADMLFIYDNYKEFRSETEVMYEQIISRLEAFLNTEKIRVWMEKGLAPSIHRRGHL